MVSRGIQHLKECEFFPLLCRLECTVSEGERSGEVLRVERRLMAEHERDCPHRELECEFCGSLERACEMNPHVEECDEFPLNCPNGCEVEGETGRRQMRRGDLPLHLDECPLQIVECPYWDYGCVEEFERRQLDFHEREAMHIHFNLSMLEMKQNKTEMNFLSDQLSEATDRIESLEKESAEKEYQIVSLESEFKESAEAVSSNFEQTQSEINELTSLLHQANNRIECLEKAGVDKNFKLISVGIEFKESTKTISSNLEQKQSEINELTSLLLQAINRIDSLEKTSADTDSKLISLTEDSKELTDSISRVVSSGRLDWKIRGVKQKIHNKETSFSDPFYVGLYQCQGHIECDSSGVGCFIDLMKGEFDEKLNWPFLYRCNFVLLNQRRNGEDHITHFELTMDDREKFAHCFQRPTEIRNEGFGSVFISTADILTKTYCKEDSISLRITVEQLPPL